MKAPDGRVQMTAKVACEVRAAFRQMEHCRGGTGVGWDLGALITWVTQQTQVIYNAIILPGENGAAGEPLLVEDGDKQVRFGGRYFRLVPAGKAPPVFSQAERDCLAQLDAELGAGIDRRDAQAKGGVA